MKPGRDLDALIVEKVMGCVGVEFIVISKDNPQPFCNCEDNKHSEGKTTYSWKYLKHYSTDISAAWEVVEKLGKEGRQIRLSNKAMDNEYWWVVIDGATVQGESAPHAICLAALKAMGVDV